MPDKFTGNKALWLAIANADYFNLFVRAWIPFNAWYSISYDLEREVDKINKVRSESNPIRNKFITLWEGTGVESGCFRNYIADLYRQLENTIIENRDNRITFSSIVIEENPTMNYSFDYRGILYTAERRPGGVVLLEAQKTGPRIFVHTPIFNYTHTKYDEDDIIHKADFIALSEERRTKLLNCFSNINPKKKVSLLSDNPDDSVLIGSVAFKRNSDLLCKGIILILYQLRCVLFHGEIVPDEATRKVYEPAFHILEMLIEALR